MCGKSEGGHEIAKGKVGFRGRYDEVEGDIIWLLGHNVLKVYQCVRRYAIPMYHKLVTEIMILGRN